MHKIIWALPIVIALAGCDPLEQQQMAGTAGGAVIGALVTPNDPLQGALIGGVVGLAAGTFLGRDTRGNCVYQRPDGSRYIATCP